MSTPSERSCETKKLGTVTTVAKHGSRFFFVASALCDHAPLLLIAKTMKASSKSCPFRNKVVEFENSWQELHKLRLSYYLRPAGGDPGVERPQKYFLKVCVSLSDLGPSEPH